MLKGSIIIALITGLVLFATNRSLAQHNLAVRPDFEDTRFGFGISAGVPISYTFKSAFNAQVQWQNDFSSYVSGFASIGYTRFLHNERSPNRSTGSINLIPLKAGIKIFPLERIYVSGEFGMAVKPDYRQSASFVYAPSVGFEFYEGLDLGLSYERFDKYDVARVAFKISYGFDITRYSGYNGF